MAEVGTTRGYKSQRGRWDLLMVDQREYNMLQLCPGIKCRNGDGEDRCRLAVLSLDGERAWEGRQVVSDGEKLASPGVIQRAAESWWVSDPLVSIGLCIL